MRLLTALILIAFSCMAADNQPRDWTAHPPIIERDAPPTLFALGDIHGDYERMIRLLAAAKIIKPGGTAWEAEKSILVITGDMIDKGPQSVNVLRFVAALQRDARESGGEVIALAGNHEAEFLAGPDTKKAADFIADLKSSHMAVSDVASCKSALGVFLCGLPYAARVGDWFFSHGGNSGGRALSQLGIDLEKRGEQLTGSDSLLEARLGDNGNWFGTPERETLAKYAAALGVHHMVQGHQHGAVSFADGVTRGKGEMFQRWGLLFLIDVGMSRGIGDSEGAILRITGNRAAAVCPDGQETVLWSTADNTDSGRAKRCGN